MTRVAQREGERGSLKWIQILVNDQPGVLDAQVRECLGLSAEERIEWVSPLRGDDYAEYRDQAFLDALGIELPIRSLETFWPKRGPQWDALGKTSSGRVLLVEAKAHAGEIKSGRTQAAEASRRVIEASLQEAKKHFGVKPDVDWTRGYYQICNRLAHLHLLRDLNGIECDLLFLYFTGDVEMKGPGSREDWQPAIDEAHRAVGLTNGLPEGASDLFIEVPC